MSDLRPTTATRQRTLNFRLRLILKYGLLRGPVPRMASSTSKPPSKPVQALKEAPGSQTYLNYILWIWECQGFQIDKFCLTYYQYILPHTWMQLHRLPQRLQSV